ncbi:MAG: hypothetical protein HBSAPP02_03890 [Phycisphaerae bacterium]|nr:MAG: molecular chaperone TorD family protein [Planctomycetia bacterium]RIK71669.1 MAG: hypothetical protein DCC66_00040 [Planctomycetota bacterium]GJQ25357.1 MAG: hypothetical protein HBSAPP02_03890 [Phycisphaerae bacterium]
MSDPNSTPTRSDPPDWIAVAKLARFLAAAFCSPRTAARIVRGGSGVRNELLAAAGNAGITADRIRRLFDGNASTDDAERAIDRVVGHTVRSECPPYELEYRSAEVFQASQTLADVAGFYRAFGFEAAGPVAERPDHAATQWEFIAVLCMKASLATREADRTGCIQALRSFLTDHAAAWMPAFFARVQKVDEGGFLSHAADLGDALLRRLSAHFDVPIGPAWLELRPTDEEDTTISCGAPGAVELGPNLAAAMEARA